MTVRRTPAQRTEPLPDTLPKAPADDPSALERTELLLRSPSYRLAEQDLDLLQRGELRPERLELEYLKAELLLREQRVDSTIVLYGGTRMAERAAAEREVARLRALLAGGPGDPAVARPRARAERLLAKSQYYDVAREFARIVSEHCAVNCPGEFIVCTGGGPGIMEAGNRGAFEADRRTIGFNITLPMEQYPNPYITPELCFRFHYFALRKLHFMLRAKALVAFPGGYGTLDELCDALCLVQTRKIEPMPIVLVGKEFWQNVLDVEFLADEGLIADEDLELIDYAETAPEIWAVIREWYGI